MNDLVSSASLRPCVKLLTGLFLAGGLSMAALAEDQTPQLTRTVLDTAFRSEGVAVGDVNHDGRLDVLAGEVWYEAPDWTRHELQAPGDYSPTGYSKTFSNHSRDINGDGWTDSVVTTMMGEPCWWFENPKNQAGHWTKHMGTRSACNETPLFADLLGNGQPVLVCGVQPEGDIAWFELPPDGQGEWITHRIAGPKAPGSDKFSHGLGVGDVNGDGRNDVLVRQGWWEAPEDRTQADWPFHPADLGEDCSDMIVFDVDNDGDQDVVTSSAHRYGIWWHEQQAGTPHPTFVRHEISKNISQTHALQLVDMNGDGIQDLVTGKRYFAHNGNDPGSGEAAVLIWLEVQRPAPGEVTFTEHVIDDNSGIGTQFAVADLNGNQRPDIAVSNKKGVFVFVQ